MSRKSKARKPRDFNQANVLMRIDPYFLDGEKRTGVEIDIGAYEHAEMIEKSRVLRAMAEWLERAAKYLDSKVESKPSGHE